MHKTNLSYAILDNADFDGAILEDANLEGASMRNVRFSPRNSIIAGFKEIKVIQFSPDSGVLAVAGSPKDTVKTTQLKKILIYFIINV